MTTTDCIKYDSSTVTVSDRLDTLFYNSAGKTALYEGMPIFSESVLPHSLFTESNFDKMFTVEILPWDYKTFNDKVVIAYFKDGTKEKAVV